MPFVYRLQKVLNFRIQKRDEQQEVVKKAEKEVLRIQGEIDQNYNNISVLRTSMRTAQAQMYGTYDNYIKHLYKVIEQLEQQKLAAMQILEEERAKLAEMEKGIKALEKHKEIKQEEYLEEEKQAEMRMLDEIAGQKHFSKMLQRRQEELEDEGYNLDEYQ